MPDRPEATLHSLPKRHMAAAALRQTMRLNPEIGIWALHGVLCELRGALLDLDVEIRALQHTREETLGHVPTAEPGGRTALGPGGHSDRQR